MSIRAWVPVINVFNKLYLQGYAAGARSEFVGLVLHLLAKYNVVLSHTICILYLKEIRPLTLFLEHLFGEESVRTGLSIGRFSGKVKHDHAYDPFLSSSFISAHFVECSSSASCQDSRRPLPSSHWFTDTRELEGGGCVDPCTHCWLIPVDERLLRSSCTIQKQRRMRTIRNRQHGRGRVNMYLNTSFIAIITGNTSRASACICK